MLGENKAVEGLAFQKRAGHSPLPLDLAFALGRFDLAPSLWPDLGKVCKEGPPPASTHELQCRPETERRYVRYSS